MNRPYTYIAADWEHDYNAVVILKKWNESRYVNFSFLDAHDLQQARDSSLNCSIKASLSARLEKSYRFILIVGDNTKNLRSGGCYLCSSYNSWTGACARGHYIDNRSYIDFECEKAIRDGMQIRVLYNALNVDLNKCPQIIRYNGLHSAMWKYENGRYLWDYDKISSIID